MKFRLTCPEVNEGLHGQVENIQFSSLVKESQQTKIEFACLKLRFFI